MTPDWFNYYGTIVIYIIGIGIWAIIGYAALIKLLDWWVLAPSRQRAKARQQAVIAYQAGLISLNDARRMAGLPEEVR